MLNKIHCGNSLELLKQMPDEFVDCVITSPPYWSLRAYQTEPQIWDDGWKGELGLEPDFNLYISHLLQIFAEIKRVLKKEGTLWINLGDTYSGSGGWNNFNETWKPNKQLKNESCNIIYSKLRKEILQDKCLCMIPYRFAERMCDELKLTLRNVIIWNKPNAMPSSATDRFTVDFEPIFFFVKSKKYYFNQQFERHLWADKDKRSKNKWEDNTPKAGKIKERIFAIRQVSYGLEGRNKRTVWTVPTHPSSEEHFASYPESLVKVMIESGCPDNGIVLDPFCGSGTTCLTAKKLNRQYIGIDLNQKYVDICNRRFEQEIGELV